MRKTRSMQTRRHGRPGRRRTASSGRGGRWRPPRWCSGPACRWWRSSGGAGRRRRRPGRRHQRHRIERGRRRLLAEGAGQAALPEGGAGPLHPASGLPPRAGDVGARRSSAPARSRSTATGGCSSPSCAATCSTRTPPPRRSRPAASACTRARRVTASTTATPCSSTTSPRRASSRRSTATPS